MTELSHSTHNSAHSQLTTTTNSVLIVVVDQNKIAIPLEQVHHVDILTTLTPLPFTAPPIEGLTRFNNRPLVQISLAKALGLKELQGGKMVVVTTPQGDIALRVDDVLGFQSTGHVPSATDADLPFTAGPLPVLRLEEILPWANIRSNSKSKQPLATDIEKPVETKASVTQQITVLQVASGEEIITLFTDSIDHVEEIDAIRPLRNSKDLIIRLADHMLPAYSLAQLLGHSSSGTEKQAVIVRGTQGAWALTVERVLGLEKIDRWHSIPSYLKTPTVDHPMPPGVWYLTEDLQMRQLFDANELIGQPISRELITDTQPQWHQPFSQLADKLSTEGLRVHCGNSIFALPMALTKRVMDDLTDAMTVQVTTGKQRAYQIPFLDGTMLLSGHPHHPQTHCNILVSLTQQRSVVFAVDRVLLQPSLPSHSWLPLTLLPPPASLFFEAAFYDEEIERWMLRVRTDLTFAQLSRSIRQSGWAVKVTKALLGWLDSEKLEEKED